MAQYITKLLSHQHKGLDYVPDGVDVQALQLFSGHSPGLINRPDTTDKNPMDVCVARQPIFDRSGQLFAYELLFHTDDIGSPSSTDSGSTAIEVIANSLLTVGLENVACGKKAFLNFDSGFLAGGLPSMLPQERVVFEISQSVEPTADLIAACQALNHEGYTFALEDRAGSPKSEQLTEIAKIVKVDVRKTSRPEQAQLIESYRPRGAAMLAGKVETHEEFEWARAAGYEYFQGGFFATAAVLKARQIPASKVNCLRLLRQMQEPELDYDQLETIISQDVSFSYRMLRYVNSALFARFGEVHSISRALAILGEDAIRHWVALTALPVLAKDKPGELVTHSLVRANFCERLSQLARTAENGQGFLMGLFSLLSALIDVPLEEALRQTGVEPVISAALLGTAAEEDPLRQIFALVCQYEAADWKAVSASVTKLGLKVASVSEAYSESTLWAQQALHATSRKTNSRRHVRHAVKGTMTVMWEDSTGVERATLAQILNVSSHGIELQLTERLAVHTHLSCSAPKFGVSGQGVVRYCNPRQGKYLIGLEFSNGTGWREPK